MATLTLHPASQLRAPFEFNWPRVSAYSGSLAFHLALALALLIPPVAMELVQRERQIVIDGYFVPPPPEVLPEPAPPTPIHKHKPADAPPVPHITMTAPEAVPAAPTTNTIAPVSDAPVAPSNAASGDGAADTLPSALAYGNRTAIPYPRDALMRHEQGKVVLRVLVGANGTPQQIEVEQSSGSPSLDRAARDAVRRWSFKPGMRGGIAYAAWALVPITFSLP